MMNNRHWSVELVKDTKDLGKLMLNAPIDRGFKCGAVLFLNDSNCGGLVEFAVVDLARNIQIDSWTLSWMSDREIRVNLARVISEHNTMDKFASYGDYDDSMISIV